MFVLDTNVVSELRKAAANRADQRVLEWVESTSVHSMFLSVMTVNELEYGVRLAERADPRKGSMLRKWLDQDVLPAFSGRILDIDEVTAIRAAAFGVPEPVPFRDALIAASAQRHRMTVVTRNLRDFEHFEKVPVLNPWTV